MTTQSFPDLEPIIIEPDPDPEVVPRPSSPNTYQLYDEDFELETDPKFAVNPPGAALRRPHFAVGEVGTWIFGGTTEWLRHQLKGKPWRSQALTMVKEDGTRFVREPVRHSMPLLLEGKPLEFRTLSARRGPKGSPIRRFTLPDIERLAWALYERHDIDGHELQRITRILVAVASQYGALEDR